MPNPGAGSLLRPRCSVIRTRFFVKKLILLSVIIAAIALPARAARAKDGHAGFKKALLHVVIFEVVYMILITQVWFRL